MGLYFARALADAMGATLWIMDNVKVTLEYLANCAHKVNWKKNPYLSFVCDSLYSRDLGRRFS
jgi:hypothetical protein